MSAAHFPFATRQSRRGFVLILVLGILLLITVLVIGFLSHATSQSKSTASYRDETGALVLSDIAVNMVKAQIDDAIANTYTGTTIWASQPGAIRVQNSSGTPSVYKLYSSYLMQDLTATTGTLTADLANDLPTTDVDTNTDWSSSPVWTDLNAPVAKSDGTYGYPIIDVRNDPTDLPAGTTGVAPFATGSFNIVSPNNLNASRNTASPGGNPYPLPMPVRWLYVLKQGQVIAPDLTSSGTSVTFTNATNAPTKPSATNPIVGRVAFWTDDDTCRVNINTAAINVTGTATGGANTYWDTPKFSSADEMAMATSQPANLEYQRFAGHPATTTLALALPELAASGTLTTTKAEAIMNLTPRYGSGGSVEGTVASSGEPTVTLPTRRLYASVDELAFNPPSGALPRTSSGLSRVQVESAKFFLTAHSRAPEVNLYGKPRISIWPISCLTGSNYRTPSDNLIGFCSTINTSSGASAYYFTRQPWTDEAADGFAITPVEGSNSTTWDIGTSNANLARNGTLLSYLNGMVAKAIPGNLSGSATFSTKYSTLGMEQILTEIFDYIRITNTRDPALGTTYVAGNTNVPTPYAAPTAYDPGNLTSNNGWGQVVPIQYSSWGTYGFGRTQGILVGMQIMFIGVGKGPTDATFAAGTYSPVPAQNVTPYTYQNFAVPPAVTTTTAGSGGENWVYYQPPTINIGSVAAPKSGPPVNANANLLNPYAPMSSDTIDHSGTAPAPLIPPPNTTAVEAVVSMTFFDPAMGYARNTEWIHPQTGVPTATGIPIAGLLGLSTSGSFSVSSSSVLTFQNLFQREVGARLGNQSGTDYANLAGANPSSLGGLLDFRLMLANRPWNHGSDVNVDGGFTENIINMPTGGNFTFRGGTVEVTVPTAYGSFGTYPNMHTYMLTFPGATLPVPNLSVRPTVGSGGDRYGQSTNIGGTDSLGGHLSTLIDFANDTIISMVPNASAGYGDYRMLAGPTPGANAFIAHPKYLASTGTVTSPPSAPLSQTDRIALDDMYPSGQLFQTSTTYASPQPHGVLAPGVSANAYFQRDTNSNSSISPPMYGSSPIVPITQIAAAAGDSSSVASGAPPDFDNGFGSLPDGPYINKPDEGGVYPNPNPVPGVVYYDNGGTQVDQTASPAFFFSPQRQVASPVMFGSLPTGAPVGGSTPKPWQTLLFQPGATGHMGLSSPKDEYLLDLFWMPQAQPYAMSEPFSTAGKVNLNYQILPFTYIDRTTALQSVLSSEKVAIIGSSLAGTYKKYITEGSTSLGTVARYPLNLSEVDGTLSQFAATFAQLGFFHSAAEICDIYMVPQGKSWGADSTLGTNGIATNSTAQAEFYGSNFALVGDNTREKPYNDVYSRLTTKSNSYVIYYRVQTLKNPANADQTQWTEGQGAVLGDYRGSTSMERYIDPNDLTVPDYPTLSGRGAANTLNLETHYLWRIVENTRFAP